MEKWPLEPRRTLTIPLRHLIDGCHGFPNLQICLKEFFAEATYDDVLIIGSNYAFTSICQFGTEDEAYAVEEQKEKDTEFDWLKPTSCKREQKYLRARLSSN